MAIYSPIFGEARGKVGGVVFSRNKGGTYMRMRATPVNPNSPRQQSTRNWVAMCAANWNLLLGAGERAAWNEYASAHSELNSLGQSIFLTGLDWYTKVSSRILDAGGVPDMYPGDLTAPAPLLTLALTVSTGTSISVEFTPVLVAGHRLFVWGSGALTVGADPNFRQMRLVGYSGAGAAAPVVLTLPYTVDVGQRLKIFAGTMSDKGMVSAMLSDSEVRV